MIHSPVEVEPKTPKNGILENRRKNKELKTVQIRLGSGDDSKVFVGDINQWLEINPDIRVEIIATLDTDPVQLHDLFKIREEYLGLENGRVKLSVIIASQSLSDVEISVADMSCISGIFIVCGELARMNIPMTFLVNGIEYPILQTNINEYGIGAFRAMEGELPGRIKKVTRKLQPIIPELNRPDLCKFIEENRDNPVVILKFLLLLIDEVEEQLNLLAYLRIFRPQLIAELFRYRGAEILTEFIEKYRGTLSFQPNLNYSAIPVSSPEQPDKDPYWYLR